METHGFLEGVVCVDGLGLGIPDAKITVYSKGAQTPLLLLTSNSAGSLCKTPLVCPARTDRPAYAYYDVVAEANGYGPHRETVPIFEGVTTYTSFSLKTKKKHA